MHEIRETDLIVHRQPGTNTLVKWQRAIGGMTLVAFLVGGWLANIVHGPACAAHCHSCGESCDDAAEVVVKHTCLHHHHHHADGTVHSHSSSESSKPSPQPHDHDCPVCKHLTMAAMTVVKVELPTLQESVRLAPQHRPFDVPRGLIGLSLSRGPPA